MLPDDAAHIPSIGAGFGTETGGIGHVTAGQILFIQHLVAVNIGEGNFSGGNQVEVKIFNFKQVIFELGQVAGTDKAFIVYQDGGKHFGIAVFKGMGIQHEVDEQPFQFGEGSFIQGETGAGDLGGTGEIEDIVNLAQFPVRPG